MLQLDSSPDVPENGRIIGIRHRIKATAAGEARPTQVTILEPGGAMRTLELENESAELDFAFGRHPIGYRTAEDAIEAKNFPSHQVKLRKDVYQVPSEFDGLRTSDTVVMILGGSGDSLAYALARRGAQVGARVMRIPPARLKANRQQDSKEDDSLLLVQLWQAASELFYQVRNRDMQLIRVREATRERSEVMAARMACAQRLRQRLIGSIFSDPNGLYPEGSIEDLYDERVANDKVLQALLSEERRRNTELKNELEALDVFTELFEPIDGCGPAIASRIISSIVDIRRFETAPKLKAFMGVHVLPDGAFARKRRGVVCNWNPQARQALYLLGDQFNRRPDSVWGQKLREYKVKFREKHPDVVIDEKGKKRYTDGHIHKMALWRTLTKFVEWLWREWTRLEQRQLIKHEENGGNNSAEQSKEAA